MAEFEVSIPDKFLKKLLEVDTDDLCKKMLNDSSPILETEMKKQVQSAIKHKSASTGELVESISAGKPHKDKNGHWVTFVGPKGYSQIHSYIAVNKRGVKTHRRYKISNALKLIWMEYGTSHQTPRPVLKKITKNANKKVGEIMQETFSKEVVK